MSGPHEPRKSRYERPSTSQIRAPSPRATKNGSPPTPRKARTGLFTPPGMSRVAARVVDPGELDPFIHPVVHLPLVGALDIVRARRIARELRGVSPVHLIL